MALGLCLQVIGCVIKTTMQPLVSVVTPTKNRLKLLSEAIASVRAQTLDAWEHVIVDDDPEDAAREEILRFAAVDPRIRYLPRTGERTGANVCRNQGVAATSSDLVVFLDSDDVLRPYCLERRVDVIRRNVDLDFVTFGGAAFEKVPGDLGKRTDNDLFGDDLVRFLCFECPWVITGPIWRKSALMRIGCFDESLPSWQDVDLHIRAIAAGLKYLRFAEVDHDVRWQFEHTKVSVQQRRSMKHLDAAPAMFVKFENAVRAGPGMNWNRQRALCSLYFYTAENMIKAGAPANARHCWDEVRLRRLASPWLYWQGIFLLRLLAMGTFGLRIGGRLVHKWKGIVRFRTIPELLNAQRTS